MKLLLTSNGVSNNILKEEFLKLVNKPAGDISIAFINTASKAEKDTSYVETDIQNIRSMGVNKIKEIDISEPKEKWEKVLKNSDVIWIEGGNTFYLLLELRKSNLDKSLKNYVRNKVYVGLSAGSIIVGPTIGVASIEPADKNDVGLTDLSALNWVDFEISPHTVNTVPLENTQKYSEGIKNKLYALDDDSAILIEGDKVRVIGGGFSKVFN